MDNKEPQMTINWGKIVQEIIVSTILLGFMSIGMTTVLCTYLGITFTYSAAVVPFGTVLAIVVVKALFTGTNKGEINE